MEENKVKVVDYTFIEGYRCIWLENILKEFQVETKEYWIKDNDDWMFEPVYNYNEPDNLEFWSIGYTCIFETDNFNHEFAEILIEAMLANTSYLELCLDKEMEEK